MVCMKTLYTLHSSFYKFIFLYFLCCYIYFIFLILNFKYIEIFKNARKQGGIKSPITGAFLEMDIWIPNLNLCFEFQVFLFYFMFFLFLFYLFISLIFIFNLIYYLG